MWPLSLLARWQRRRQRTIDRTVLFPILRAYQKTWEHGTQAILQHVHDDEAWRFPDEYAGEAIEAPVKSASSSVPLPFTFP